MQNLTLSWQSAGGSAAALLVTGALVRRRTGAAALLREAGTVLGLFAVWQFAGQLSLMGTGGAVGRARWIWDTERWLRLPSEAAVQSWVLPHPLLVQLANYYYASMHFGVMIVFLLWLFLRHREAYPRVRTVVVLVTAASLLVQFIPVAPPRLLDGDGMVDTAALYGQSVYTGQWGDSLAAMPSVHVAWCVLVAVEVVRVARGPLRWLILAHPLLTVLVVVATANHFWLDGVAAVLLLVLAYLLTDLLRRSPPWPASP